MSSLSDALGQAVADGIAAAKPVGEKARAFVEEFLEGHKVALGEIASALAKGDIDRATADFLLSQEMLLVSSEAAALKGLTKVAIEAAANAFIKSATNALTTLIKAALV